MDYYVSFKTEDKNLNITITPQLCKYDTENRNLPETPKTLVINDIGKTILTNPENKEYVFVQMEICTPEAGITYEFKNAFYNTSLGQKGQIQSGTKYAYQNIINTKLDTELELTSNYKDVNMFIKHTGLDDIFTPDVKEIDITFKKNTLTFNQPISGEEFKYTILLDKKGNIQKQDYTICSFSTNRKMAYFTDYVISSENKVSYEIDFDKDKLHDYKDFEVLILAEELKNGKMMILSEVFSPKNTGTTSKKTRNMLIVVAIILAVICVVGGVSFYLYMRKLKNRPRGVIRSKPTDITDIESANTGEKMLDRMTQSQVSEQ